MPMAAPSAVVRAPAPIGGATFRAPPIGGGAAVRVPPVSGGTAIRTPPVNAGAAAGVRAVPNVSAATRPTTANLRTNWQTATPAQLQRVNTNLNAALQARASANAAATTNATAARNAASANSAANVRTRFLNSYGPYYRGYPYFGTNFWVNQNIIGLGLGGYGYGPYDYWWGYSPWLGYQPWSYWYGNPGWNTFASYYGWSTPYYYDYGPGGNVVYHTNQVLVNDQPVGTPADYAQSAAELATITPEEMNAPHEWIPLGTFIVATSKDDTNPARVAQLAYDNKTGLISGTIFNRQSGNRYTIQGKVDPQTQRVAFTIGKDPNIVLETGLYNLTQDETPVLVHFGPNKTAIYRFIRLHEPQQSDQPATTATAPATPLDENPQR